MSFAERDALILLWLVPLCGLLLWLSSRQRRRRLAAFAALRLDELLTHQWSPGRSTMKGVLWLLAAACLVLALARPRWGFEWREVPRGGIDIIVALDLSTSMLANDIAPSRLERAKREVMDLVQMLEGDRLGIVAFAGVAFVQAPLTVDYRLASLFISQLSTDLMPVQGTAIGEAIRLAVETLEKASSADSQGKAIILITDGEDQSGDALAAARLAKEKGIKIYGIGIGGLEGAPIPLPDGGFKKTPDGQVVVSKLDEATLEQLVLETEGIYVRSTTGDLDLDHIYRQGIRAKISDLDYGSSRQRIWYERFQWFLLAAFLLLVGEQAISEYRRRRRSGAGGVAKLLVGLGTAALLGQGFISERGVAASADDGVRAYADKDYEKATKSFLEAEITEPHELRHAYNRAVSQYQAGDYEGAASGFAKAAQASDKALAAKSYYNLGNSLVGKGDLEGAKAAFEQAMKLDPKDKAAQENRAWVEQALAQKPPPQQGGEGDKNKKNDDDKQQQGEQNQQQGDQQQQGQKNEQDGDEGKQKQKESDAESGGSQQDQKSPKDGEEGAQQADGQPKPDENQGANEQDAKKEPAADQAGGDESPKKDADEQQKQAGAKEGAEESKNEQQNKAAEDKQAQQEKGEQTRQEAGKEASADEQQAAAGEQDKNEQGHEGGSAGSAQESEEQKRGREAGMMKREAAERLLRSLENQDELYGRPPQYKKPAHPSKRDW